MTISAQEQRPGWGLAALLGAAGAAALALLWYATRRGIGLWGDSLDYVSAARSIAAGRGVYSLGSSHAWEPLTTFPPFYPALLGSSGILRIDPLVGARAIHALLFAAMTAIVGKLTWRTTRSLVAAAMACLLAMTALAETFATAQSEGTFIVLLLAGLGLLARHLERKNPLLLVGAALAVGMALLTRYAGASLVVVATGVLLVCSGPGQRSVRRRLAETAIFLAVALAPTAAWAWHLGSVQVATAREFIFHPPDQSKFKQALQTIGHWIGIKNQSAAPYAAAAALAVGLAYLAWRFVPQPRRGRKLPGGPLVGVLLSFALAYVPFLILSISFMDAATPLNSRILSPLLAPTLIVAMALVWEWFTLVRKLRPILLALVAVICLARVYHAAAWANLARAQGLGYSSVAWQQSTILQWVRQLPPETPVYSNGKDAIYLLTGRITYALPRIQRRKKNTANSDARISQQMHAMHKDLRRNQGVVVYFAGLERDDYLADAQFVAQYMPLQKRLSFVDPQNPKGEGAGEVYDLAAEATTQRGGEDESPGDDAGR